MGCVRAFKWTPVVFISAVVFWSYYAYVIQMCLFTVPSIPEKIVYLLVYHPLFVMFIWSYWQTIFTAAAKVPKQFYLSRSDLEKLEGEDNETNQRDLMAQIARDLPVQTRTVNGAIRYCEKCKAIKPDRCHHCSVCGQCVLKMDHHCPWVNNCVCFANYKFFVLFLGYAFVYCLFVAATSCQYFIHFWTEGLGQDFGKFHILFLFFASIMFAISLISLLGYHLYLTSLNRSTLESFRAPVFRSGPDKHGFNLGRRVNYQEVFGDQRARWLLPIFSSLGDGTVYPLRTPLQSQSYEAMGNTTTNNASTAQLGVGATGNSLAYASASTPPSGPLGPPNNPQTDLDEVAIIDPSQISMGDGVTYPSRQDDVATDSLLGQRQRWEESEEEDSYGATGSQLTYTNNVALTVITER